MSQVIVRRGVQTYCYTIESVRLRSEELACFCGTDDTHVLICRCTQSSLSRVGRDEGRTGQDIEAVGDACRFIGDDKERAVE